MWRTLRGIVRLVADEGTSVEAAAPKVKAVIARACENDDFDALEVEIRETASRVAAALVPVTGQEG